MSARLRGHSIVGHTADVGLQASARDLPALFEEAASALADIAADVGGIVRGSAQEVTLQADDLAALAYLWLNELIGLGQARGEALAGTVVGAVEERVAGGWRLSAVARFVPFTVGGSRGARARVDVKSATYHRLAVRHDGDGWAMTAYLDV